MEEIQQIKRQKVDQQNYKLAWGNFNSVILFVKMANGQQLTPQLKKDICNTLRKELSPRHVPSLILPVPDIPYTPTMKKVELVVRRIITGEEITSKSSIMNPECLEFYKNIKELKIRWD